MASEVCHRPQIWQPAYYEIIFNQFLCFVATKKRIGFSKIQKNIFYSVNSVIVGPWDIMKEFDDRLRERDFDNVRKIDWQADFFVQFQFVEYHKFFPNGWEKSRVEIPDLSFATAALQKIPGQYP